MCVPKTRRELRSETLNFALHGSLRWGTWSVGTKRRRHKIDADPAQFVFSSVFPPTYIFIHQERAKSVCVCAQQSVHTMAARFSPQKTAADLLIESTSPPGREFFSPRVGKALDYLTSPYTTPTNRSARRRNIEQHGLQANSIKQTRYGTDRDFKYVPVKPDTDATELGRYGEAKPSFSEVMEDDEDGGSSFLGATANGVNILLGVGVLSLPYALRASGWYVGLGLLLFLTCATNYTGKLIGIMMGQKGIRDFASMGRVSFGILGERSITIIFFLELFSACGMYLILAGDNLHSLFPQKSQFFWTMVGACIMVPTAMTSKLSYLSYFSIIGTLASAFLWGAVIFLGSTMTKNEDVGGGSYLDPAPTRDFTNVVDAPFAIGLVMVGFAGHACFPSIKSSLADPKDYNRVLNASYLACGTVYVSMAVLGYLMYGIHVQDEISLNIQGSVNDKAAPVTAVARYVATISTWLVVVNPCTKFGLTMNPVALLVEELCLGEPIDSDEGSVKRNASALFIRISLSAACVLVAVSVPRFADVVAFVGAFCSCFVSVVFPCAAYLKLFDDEIGGFERCVLWFLLVVGVIMCVWGTYAVVNHLG